MNLCILANKRGISGFLSRLLLTYNSLSASNPRSRGGERFRLRLLSQGKRAEEAGMISLTTQTRATN